MLGAPCANQAGLQLWCYRQPATYPSYSFVFARETAFGYRSRDKRRLLFRCSAIVTATVVDAIVVIVVLQRSASAIRVFRPLSHPILLAVLLSQISLAFYPYSHSIEQAVAHDSNCCLVVTDSRSVQAGWLAGWRQETCSNTADFFPLKKRKILSTSHILGDRTKFG